MIPVVASDEPADFDETVRKKGQAWLDVHPEQTKRPPAYWDACASAVADAFAGRCGWAGMYDPTGGTVDHFYSWKNFPYLAYEWENYRFACATINSSKKDIDDAVLDPCEIGEGWFEVILPSLQLVLTDSVPENFRVKAEFTLKRLKLDRGERILKWRLGWYQMYQQGRLDLEGLRMVAPLLASALEKQERLS